MLWLDSISPPDKKGQPGAARGPCSVDSGDPAEVRRKYANSQATFGSISFGEIGSTTQDKPEPHPPKPDPTPGKYCCAFYQDHCDNLDESSWCNQSEEKCTKDCSGKWVPAPKFTSSILDE